MKYAFRDDYSVIAVESELKSEIFGCLDLDKNLIEFLNNYSFNDLNFIKDNFNFIGLNIISTENKNDLDEFYVEINNRYSSIRIIVNETKIKVKDFKIVNKFKEKDDSIKFTNRITNLIKNFNEIDEFICNLIDLSFLYFDICLICNEYGFNHMNCVNRAIENYKKYK